MQQKEVILQKKKNMTMYQDKPSRHCQPKHLAPSACRDLTHNNNNNTMSTLHENFGT